MKGYKNFFRFVIPSVLAFALSGVYTIVDGFFIGQSLGDIGLASIVLDYPIAAIIQALGTGIGLSGAIQYTIMQARECEEKRTCLGGTTLLMLLASGLITVLLLVFLYPLLHLLGAEREILRLTASYIRVIAVGTVFQLLATGFVPFIRNMGGAVFAMTAMIAGFLSNVFLDYLFVPKWGMAGAAWATVIGQAVTMLLAVGFFIKKKIGFALPHLSAILGFFGSVGKVAAAPFGLTISPTITIILMNRFLLLHGNEQDVAAYSCISYVVCIAYLLLQGVGDGCQPLVSRYYGENDMMAVMGIRKLAYKTAFAISACMYGSVVFDAEICWLVVRSISCCQSGSSGLSAVVFGSTAVYLFCAGYNLLFLCYGKNRIVLCPGICRAGIPACAVPASAFAFGTSGCMAGSTPGAGIGMYCFILRKETGRL